MPRKKTKPVRDNKSLPLKLSPTSYVVIFFIIMLCILFASVIFSGKTFVKPDSMAAKSTSAGMKALMNEYDVYPLWNPYIFSGMPAFESMSFNKYVYFPSFVLYLLTLIGFSGDVLMILHYLLAGLGAYFLLRYFRIEILPALFGGFAFAFTPYLITMLTFGHGSQMMTAAYIPIVFYFALRVWDEPGLEWTLFMALFLGFQMQRAHIQIVYYTYMLLGAYFIYRLILVRKKGSDWKRFGLSAGYFFAAVILAFGMAAVLYLPVAEYSQYSIRGARSGGGTGFDYATAWSFHPAEMMTFLVPSWFGFGGQTYWGHMPFTDYPNYMGILTLLLAICALIVYRRPVVYFLFAIAGLGLLISFGKHFFLYSLLYKYLPYFNKFRVPAMMLIMVQFSVALLAAFGFQGLMRILEKMKNDENLQEKIIRVIYGIWIILGVVVLYITLLESSFRAGMVEKFSQHMRSAPYAARLADARYGMLYKDLWIVILIIASASVLYYLLLKKKITRTFFSVSIIGLAVVDLFLVDFKLVDTNSKKALDRYLQPDGVTQYLSKDTTLFRVYPIGNLFNEKKWSAGQIESIGGYHPAKLGIYQRFMEKTSFKSGGILRMLNVKYVLSTKRFNDPRFTEVKQTYARLLQGNIPVVIYRFREFLPRAFFAGSVRIVPDDETIYQKVVEPDFRPELTAFITDSVDLPVELADSAEILDIRWAPHRIEIDYQSDKDAFLILSEVYYPVGWKASIDGKNLPVYKTNALLRGVIVPSGKKTLIFTYEQPYIRIGFVITLLVSLFIFSGILYIYRSSIIEKVKRIKIK